jgi:hypothetical protein
MPPYHVTDPDHSLGDVTPGQRYLDLVCFIHPALAHRAIVGGSVRIAGTVNQGWDEPPLRPRRQPGTDGLLGVTSGEGLSTPDEP